MSFTKLYLTNRAAAYGPATFRGSWDDTVAVVTRSLEDNKAEGSPVASVARTETSASQLSYLLYRGVSGRLAAQTISGTIQLVAGCRAEQSANDYVYHVHVYATQGDSDTPRGTLLSDYVDPNTHQWPEGSSAQAGRALDSPQSMSALAVSDGDRLVVEIGFHALNTLTGNRTGRLWYGFDSEVDEDLSDGDTAVTTKSGFIEFSNAISQFVEGLRVSSVIRETASQGGEALRVSSVVRETAGRGVEAVRVSSVIRESANRGVEAVRMTSVIREVMSANEEDDQMISFVVT